jgi:HK97 family phage prohead protease
MPQPTVAPKTMECRTITGPVEIRAAEDGRQIITGYAAKFGVQSEDLGGFVEVIDKHFFDSVLGDDVRALINHDANLVLGRTEAKTCRLSIDAVGLRYEIDPPNTSYANDLAESLRRGDISQSSFAFRVDYENDGDTWIYDSGKDLYIRTLIKCKRLYDVSPVTYPAYQQTEADVSQRSLDKLGELRQQAKMQPFTIRRKRLELAEKDT